MPLRGFRPLRRATKGSAFGNRKPLKRLDLNLIKVKSEDFAFRRASVKPCVRPVSERNFKVKRSNLLSRDRIFPRGGKFRWIFGEALKKGCLQTFEELFQKSTIVLPQAKCRETSLYFHSLSASSLKGSGNFLLRKFPVSPVLP